MSKLLLFFVTVLLAACASTSPPASTSFPVASEANPQPAGAAQAQGRAKERDDLKAELAAVDVALADLSKRVAVARDDVKADVKQQLALLQTREEDINAQPRATRAIADAEAAKARSEIHRAISDLRVDMQKLADRIPR